MIMNDCFAAIDIGSNAVRLLIKRVNDTADNEEKRLSKALMLRFPLRLGFDVFSKGEVSDEKTAKLLRLMKTYKHLMKLYDVTSYRACATSAMRDAKNGSEILKKVYRKTGIAIELIDGQEEARIIYNNHMECGEDRTGNHIYVDVGGGSTEINILHNGELVESHSYNIGTVRILSHAVKDEAWLDLESDLADVVKKYTSLNIIGSGGNINKLYRLSGIKSDDNRLPVAKLEELYGQLNALSVDERRYCYSLNADRADVIVPAAFIFLKIAHIVKADYVYVPTIGLADGIIDNLYLESRGGGNSK